MHIANVTDYFFRRFLPLIADEGLYDNDDLQEIHNLFEAMEALLVELDARLLAASEQRQLSLASIESGEVDISLQLPAGLPCAIDLQDYLTDRYLLGANAAYLLEQGDFPTLIGIDNMQTELSRRFRECILERIKKF